jgi:type I restriction-modification system DNA methylase subunit/restriction endonuclease S subunit
MDKNNIHQLLTLLQFEQDGNIYTKKYSEANEPLKVDISGNGHIYYRECGLTIGRETTCNLLEPENLVVLHCVDKLLSKGYNPVHLELEPAWKLGHSSKGGYADIWVRTFKNNAFDGSDSDKESLLIIECKKWSEFNGAWIDTKEDGGQLFSYFQQELATKFLCLYTADIIEGKLEQEYYLINVQDNDEMLVNNDTDKIYKKSSNNKQLYRVWHDTYLCDYATRGLFENDIAPYRIGKNKYSISDLKAVDNDTIQKKYNEFALILRQHNVGGHENAFDKLVNLFLAKVVDETNNPDDLHFYWKGAAYDDDFRLQDRLQRLYRDGMKRFLNEDVTYIENSEIEKAFRRFKADPDATKKTIMGYFRALKFFSDNDFSFISVHNKRLFEQNATILLKVVKMLQDIKLKDSDQNQLLGDLFEGFLNKGVKQSEGQFFTPMPIVRFLVSSLPLEQIIKSHDGIPKVIDYACGAGHFLTEYAMQIKDFVEEYRPNISVKDFYANIIGIEKEYRLSKVSKVSAFMYGHDEINIIYADALVPHSSVQNGTFDILIANPPYSVKGFLETLTEEQRKMYNLFNDNLNIGKNNAIETFFIERAAQLLKTGGVAGIILPISVLNKDGIYARAREIILKKFDIIALAEFGSGTFGKTGTNTVTMFLRRKETNTPDEEHYFYRVNSWFNSHDNAGENYLDMDLVEDYCSHCGYLFADYKEFIGGAISENILKNDIFQNYYTSFFGNQRNAMKGVCEPAKIIRARFKSKQATQAYRRLSQDEKQNIENKAFFDFVVAIEKEKLYYFILAKIIPNPVIIVKSPSGTVENKRFLGYEWSDSKGNEGIKYLNINRISSTDEDGDAEEDDIILQIRGINGIQTPLFNPNNFVDYNKINTIIRTNFEGESFVIPSELSDTVFMGNLVDMIDFSRTSFNLEFKTSFTLRNEIISRFPLIDLDEICCIKGGYTFPKHLQGNQNESEIPFYKVSDMNTIGNELYMVKSANYVSEQVLKEELSNVSLFKAGTIIFPKVGMSIHTNKKRILGRDALVDNNTMGISSKDTNILLNKYLYNFFVCKVKLNTIASGANPPSISAANLGRLKIPLPSVLIQQQIVDECEIIEKEYQSICYHIEDIKAEMERIMLQAQSEAKNVVKFNRSDLFSISIGRRVLKSEIVEEGVFDVFSANVFEPFGKTNHSVLSDFSKPSILWGIDGDWMVNYRESNKPFNPTDHCGVIRVLDESVINPRYLVYPLLKAGEVERFSRANRASTERIKALTIMVPDIEIQDDVAEKVIALDNKLLNLYEVLKKNTKKKQEVLDKYLK